VLSYLLLSLSFGGPADLAEIAARKEVAWSCEAATGRHVIRAGSATIVVVPGFARATVNGAPVTLQAPAKVLGGRLLIPGELAKIVLDHAPDRGKAAPEPAIARPAPSAPEPKPAKPAPSLPIRIAIDPGHGGMHTGYPGRSGLLEKDINLDVSLELRRILESWGARVTMTRTTDRHFSADIDDDLQARIDIVNRAAPDLFLSIHANGADNAGARGFEVWVPMNARGARDTESRRLAQTLLGALHRGWEGDSPNRGVKDEKNLRVLRGTNCPAALVELEFVSNRAAERELARTDRRMRLAAEIAEAVRRWAQAR
jgi:N-acetylmuramoyl-L-alanine amidase